MVQQHVLSCMHAGTMQRQSRGAQGTGMASRFHHQSSHAADCTNLLADRLASRQDRMQAQTGREQEERDILPGDVGLYCGDEGEYAARMTAPNVSPLQQVSDLCVRPAHCQSNQDPDRVQVPIMLLSCSLL